MDTSNAAILSRSALTCLVWAYRLDSFSMLLARPNLSSIPLTSCCDAVSLPMRRNRSWSLRVASSAGSEGSPHWSRSLTCKVVEPSIFLHVSWSCGEIDSCGAFDFHFPLMLDERWSRIGTLGNSDVLVPIKWSWESMLSTGNEAQALRDWLKWWGCWFRCLL